MFQHEDCRGFDILNHAIRMGSAEEEWGLGTLNTTTESSQVSPGVVSPPMQSSNSFQFPWKLYDMLEQAEQDGLQDIVAWQGENSFKVLRIQEFVERVMPRYFKQTKYKSFQRQLNLYGYTRINEGPGKGGYKHKYFLRGNKALCQYISRQSNEESSALTSGASVSSSSNSSFHAPLGTLTAQGPMVTPRNAAINHHKAVSPNTSTKTQFASKPASPQVCDKDINDQYKALIQKDYQFPWKLYEMLEKAPGNDYENIVSWQPPGYKCFRVHDPNLFVSTVMPLFFKQTKYKSFQRQLNLYGFARVDEGPNKGSYMHKLFQKDRRDLLSGMNRQKSSQCLSRSQIMGSQGTGNCSAEKENSTQLMDVSEPIPANRIPESQGSEVKCIDYGIPTVLRSMPGEVEIENAGLTPTGRSEDCQLKWRRTAPDGSCDWTIAILHNNTFERESFHVHQRVFIRGERQSKYFARLFESKSASVAESVLVLGPAEAAIFSNILDYIYYGISPKLNMRIAFSYFMIGKSLGIDSLRQLVVDFYLNAMHGDNIRDFIQVVCDFEDNLLLESAINYFAEERKSMDVALAGKLKPQMLRRILYHSNNQLERGCDATTASRFVAESLYNHARFLSREQLLRMVDDEILTSIDGVAAIKLLAAYVIVCDGEQLNCADSSLKHQCVTTIAKDWSRMRNEFEKSPVLVKAFKSFSSEVLFDILMKTTQSYKYQETEGETVAIHK